MLTISESVLKKEAKERGYRPEILEKASRAWWKLLDEI
jgi:hypothetical protein